jgi:hypothetical protein
MYADVEEDYPGAALELQAELRASAAAAAQTASAALPAASAGSSPATSNASNSAGSSETVQQSTGAPHSRQNSGVTSTPSINSLAASPTPPATTKQYLLLCVEADPLPRFEQVELIKNCDDYIFFQQMRQAYESLCSKRVFDFADDTPRWVQDAVKLLYSLGDRIHNRFVKLLVFLHIRWLVRSVGDSIFSIPNTANFVMVSLIIS